MAEKDDFDRIVEGLHLDLSFPDEPADPAPQPSPTQHADRHDEDPEPAEEPFYRQVEPAGLMPRRRGVLLAWIGVIGAPLLLVLATVAHVYLGRSVVAGAALIFVASATYLFLQLPEHGPSQRDWPDDGAVL
ncbi:hypothetical protein GEV29_14835 [Aeromicrobium sp. SMF47]|uniref:hypothetical protein n=1 Tax=Aeromicrobium TaxID=2040 RepID=UPI00129D9037|nr:MULTISPECIES: hypothetical protein [Aeromicrobium]MRJ77817.1 hypothetical protein [Aeromicrobium yanjiei]MRK02186.1 hypothetical protein [Aeromicrobium sp. S22]